jgi:hypothetical protein
MFIRAPSPRLAWPVPTPTAHALDMVCAAKIVTVLAEPRALALNFARKAAGGLGAKPLAPPVAPVREEEVAAVAAMALLG